MTPEERQQFEKTLADLKLPEQPAPDDVTPMAQPEEELTEVSIDVPELPTTDSKASPIADVQQAFQDGAGQLAQKPAKGDDFFAQELNREAQDVEIREPRQGDTTTVVDVDPPQFPMEKAGKFDADRHEQGKNSIPSLEAFMQDMAKQGKLDEDGFLPENETFRFQPNVDQAEPNEGTDLGDGAASDATRKLQSALQANERAFRAMAAMLSRHDATLNQIVDGLLRGQS